MPLPRGVLVDSQITPNPSPVQKHIHGEADEPE